MSVTRAFKKKVGAGFFVVVSAFTLLSCGEEAWTGEDASRTTLGIDREGRVTEVVIEDFGEDYYDVNELRLNMESDIDDYNKAAGSSDDEEPPIVLGEIKRDGSSIRTTTVYKTPENYGDFTLEELYYGTLRQARLRGYELPSVMDNGGGESYEVSAGDDDNHVIVSDGHDCIVAPYRIIAVSEGVRLISETEADLSGAGGRSALLLER